MRGLIGRFVKGRDIVKGHEVIQCLLTLVFVDMLVPHNKGVHLAAPVKDPVKDRVIFACTGVRDEALLLFDVVFIHYVNERCLVGGVEHLLMEFFELYIKFPVEVLIILLGSELAARVFFPEPLWIITRGDDIEGY